MYYPRYYCHFDNFMLGTYSIQLPEMFFLYLLVFIHSASAIDYCNICENRTHTLCQFKEGPSASCFDYHEMNLTDQLKNYIVDIHNDIRNHIASGHELKGQLGSQPSASNMNQLEWDDELATIAQRWADQCISINSTVQHDTCRNTERFDVGQNILTAITMGTELPELAILILNWYKQVSEVIPSDIHYFSGIRRGQLLIGQYTQLVWAETKYVGCGISIFREHGNPYYFQRLVCNYGPGGNVIGEPVYIKGIPCTKCPTRRCDSYRTNLCQNPSPNHTKIVPTTIILTDESFALNQPDDSPCFITSEDSVQADINTCFESLGYSGASAHIPIDEIYFSTVNPLMNKTTLHVSSQTTQKRMIKNCANTINMVNNIENIGHDAEVSKKRSRYGRGLFPFKNIGHDKEYKYKQHEHKDNETGYIKVNGEEVEFPDNLHFKRATGKWQDGHCRCNLIYRSSITIIKFQQILLVLTCFLNMI